MSNGGDGQQHDTLATLLLSIFAFVSWLARFVVGRYFNRKDKAEDEKRRQKELKEIFRGVERRRKARK